jgi:DNA mismatch repair protein MutS2
VDLASSGWGALDWAPVKQAWSAHARTTRGVAACLAAEPLPDAASIRRAHDAVDEWLALREAGVDVPVGGVADIEEIVVGATKGHVLDGPQVRLVGATCEALDALRAFCGARADAAPTIAGLAQDIDVDGQLLDELTGAFDRAGLLSARRWPELGELRELIQSLHASIRRTLEEVLRDDAWGEVLQDQFVAQRQDRYVVPVKAEAKRWNLGIVHGTSGSGATVFIEPAAVVEANNRLKVAEGQLEALERRILTELTRWIAVHSGALLVSLDAATRIDLVAARAGFAAQLRMTRPQVSEAGVVRLLAARHPALALTGIDVVPNDLDVGGDTPLLVLSGPNAGGKTVALKTVGLCALLVRHGCFVPAEAGSRVDAFTPILADIGDSQALALGLSSFTGQVAVLNAMLAAARPGSLLLLDEIATGTDPGQGAALATAVLEALVDAGATVVVTTHYAQLKGLAATDPRCAVAAVEHGEPPTYHVVRDATGESHAFEVALRAGLPPRLVERARAHQGDAERRFTEALEELDAERGRLSAARGELDRQRREIERQRAEISIRERALAEGAEKLRQQAASGFVERVKKAEAAIAAVVADLQRSPGHDVARRARATLDALKDVVPAAPAAPTLAEIAVGDRVRLGNGVFGEVQDLRDDVVTVQAGALVIRSSRADVTRIGAALESLKTAPPPRTSKNATSKKQEARRTPIDDAVRLPGNTLDLRGQRVDEALDAVEKFLDDALRMHHDVVFVLHGHGTGALKTAVRRALQQSKRVERTAPANANQGGDAYTAVALRD